MAHVRNDGDPLDGSELIDGLLRNEPQVIRTLYRHHFSSVQRFILQNSGTRSDAEDIFQETLTILWLNAKEGRVTTDQHGDLGGYINRVARNKWLDMLRSAEYKRNRFAVAADGIDLAHERADDTEDRLERLRIIYAALDERCRSVLDRFYFHRQELSTIATALGVDEASIRTIKYRCMMKLRAFRVTITGEKELRTVKK